MSGQPPAPVYAGLNPLGAPVTITVPLTVPGDGWQIRDELPGQHELKLLLVPVSPELPLQDIAVVVASRSLRPVRPKPDAISGSTVTSKMKLASAMTVARVRRCQVFMTTPPSLVPCYKWRCYRWRSRYTASLPWARDGFPWTRTSTSAATS